MLNDDLEIPDFLRRGNPACVVKARPVRCESVEPAWVIAQKRCGNCQTQNEAPSQT